MEPWSTRTVMYSWESERSSEGGAWTLEQSRTFVLIAVVVWIGLNVAAICVYLRMKRRELAAPGPSK